MWKFTQASLAEGQLQTTREHVAEFFGGLSAARVIIEVGTHSAWVREVLVGCGHEGWWPTRD
jgi:hypothetical protein